MALAIPQPAPRYPRIRKTIAYVTGPQQQAYYTKAFPDYDFITLNPLPHGHPCAHTERDITEEWAYALLGGANAGQILDAGGSPNRHRNAGRVNIWCARPTLSVPDAMQRLHNPAMFAGCCSHRAEDCRCHDFDSLMMVHTAYYFTAAQTALMLSRTTRRAGVIVVHMADAPVGNMFPPSPLDPSQAEMSFTTLRSGHVVTKVVGNSCPYKHDDLVWPRLGCVATTHGYLISNMVRSTPHTQIFLIGLTSVAVEAPISLDMPLGPAMVSGEFYGSVDVRSILMASEKLYQPMLHQLKIVSYGHEVAVWRDNDTPVVMPKGLVSEVALAIHGSRINGETYQRAINAARKATSQMGITADMRLECVSISSLLALFLNVRSNTAALNDAMFEYAIDVEDYNRARDIQPSWYQRSWAFVNRHKWKVGLALAAVGLAVSYIPLPKMPHLQPRNPKVGLMILDNLVASWKHAVEWVCHTVRAYACGGSVQCAKAVDHAEAVAKWVVVGTRNSLIKSGFSLATLGYVVFLGPAMEELIKRIPYFGPVYPALEFAQYYAILSPYAPLSIILQLRGPALIMHYSTILLPYFPAVALHVLFNLYQVIANHGMSLEDFLAGDGAGSWFAGAVIVGIICVAGLVWDYCAARPATTIHRDIRDNFINFGRGTAAATQHLLEPVTVPAMQAAADLTAQLKEGVRILVRPDISTRSLPQHVAKSVGLVEPTRLPTIYHSDQAAELAALYNRHYLHTPLVTHDMSRVVRWLRENFDVLFPVGFSSNYDYDVWYDIWNSRFPAAQQVKHNDAVRYNSMWPTRKFLDNAVTDAHVKRENTMKSDVDGTTIKAPRLIQASDPRVNVVTSPWVYFITQEIKKNWHRGHFIFFICGCLGDEVGLWMTERFITGHEIRKRDLAKYDTSQRPEVMVIQRTVFDLANRPSHLPPLMDNDTKTGNTPNGVHFTGPCDRLSGWDTTTVGNFIHAAVVEVYETCVEHNIDVRDLHRQQYAFAGTGDDSVKVSLPRLRTQGTMVRAFGFEATDSYVNDPTEAEVISCRFYPVLNNTLGTNYVLGPKLGRVFARSGWIKTQRALEPVNVGKITTGDLREMCGNWLGVLPNVQHVPLARIFISHQLALAVAELRARQVSAPTLCVTPIMQAEVTRKPTLKVVYKHDPYYWTMILNVYGITRHDCDEFLSDIHSIRRLPAIIHNSVTNKAILTDC